MAIPTIWSRYPDGEEPIPTTHRFDTLEDAEGAREVILRLVRAVGHYTLPEDDLGWVPLHTELVWQMVLWPRRHSPDTPRALPMS